MLSWLFVFTFSLALNLLSFSVAPRWLVPALLTVLFILILQMRIAMKSKTGWQWNPAIHFYLNCHAEFLSFAWQASEEAAEALLPGLKVWHSLAYFSALDAALFALGIGGRGGWNLGYYWRIKMAYIEINDCSKVIKKNNHPGSYRFKAGEKSDLWVRRTQWVGQNDAV